jgi:hypothetical protein
VRSAADGSASLRTAPDISLRESLGKDDWNEDAEDAFIC